MKPQPGAPGDGGAGPPRPRGRAADAVLGTILVVAAVAIAPTPDVRDPAWAIAAALAVGGLGVDALAAAVRGTRSLVSRIGPLP